MIKNIIFDLGGVIVDTNPANCVSAFKRIGFSGMEELLGKSEQKGFLYDFEVGDISLADFCNEVRSHIASENPAIERMPTDKAIVDAYLATSGRIPEEKMAMLNKLRTFVPRTVNISALSNTDKLHWEACKALFIEHGCLPDEVFEHIWISCDLGVAKPDREIFWKVLEECDYKPCETLFIDDSEKNCDAAGEFGFRTFCPKQDSDWYAHIFEIIEWYDNENGQD